MRSALCVFVFTASLQHCQTAALSFALRYAFLFLLQRYPTAALFNFLFTPYVFKSCLNLR